MSTFIENVQAFWNEWDIRITVLLSLFFQVMLILFGSRRTYVVGSWISILVWLSYLTADWIATMSLGILAKNQYRVRQGNENSIDPVMGIWAPFLLLHLGGPDTITAYALEDNELWLRHLLGLSTQLSVAFAIMYNSWSNSAVSFVSIPICVAGIIKYAERTWALRSASSKQFQSPLLSTMPSYSRFSHLHKVPEDVRYLHQSYYSFDYLKRIFADLHPVESKVVDTNMVMIPQGALQEAKLAFKQMETELKFLYDVLYTKAPIIYSVIGLFFRVFCSMSLISALVLFISADKHMSLNVNVMVTYGLLVGAIFLDIWAFIMLILSDWTILWLTMPRRRRFPDWIYKAIIRLTSTRKRWSRKMPQHCVIDFCFTYKASKCLQSKTTFSLALWVKTLWKRKWEHVDDQLIKLILDRIREMWLNREIFRDGSLEWDKAMICYNRFRDSEELANKSFNFRVFAWHIATKVSFYLDENNAPNEMMTISSQLADYMIYILVMRPTLLPKWFGGVRFIEDTYEQTLKIFRRKKGKLNNRREACSIEFMEIKEDLGYSKSVLWRGYALAIKLEVMEDKWLFLSKLWMEIIIYAAGQAAWRAHAQQLRRGGELLTHVSLFMTHLGISDIFTESQADDFN